MIIEELAYKVTVRADEFLHGKQKVKQEARNLKEAIENLSEAIDRSTKHQQVSLKKQSNEFEKFSKSAVTSFKKVGLATAGFLGIGVGLGGLKNMFAATALEMSRANNQAKFFGTNINKIYGMRRGFAEAGLNADTFTAGAASARMALANLKDPTVMGGLTGAAQNLLALGARTGLNIDKLGDPNTALAEFTRYGKMHSQENLMQVMAAAGFDPTDAAKIKSGELKKLVDAETKKSRLMKEQVEHQEKLLKTLGELDAELDRIKKDLIEAFSPTVIEGLKSFGKWLEEHQGDIEGFFENARDAMAKFVESVGGATNALKLLAAAYVGSKLQRGGRASPLLGLAPPWVTGLLWYGSYLYENQDSVRASVEGSADYTKSVAGHALESVGIRTDLGRRDVREVREWPEWANWMHGGKAGRIIRQGQSNGLVYGNNIQPDIPGQVGIRPIGDDEILDAIRAVESSNGARLKSPSGKAIGEYQLEADTARDWGLTVNKTVDERRDPFKSRMAAAYGIHKHLQRYKGNVDLALLAYNWGAGNVDNALKKYPELASHAVDDAYWAQAVPEFRRNYVRKARNAMGIAPGERLAYYQQQLQQAQMPANAPVSVDNSQTTTTYINNVNLSTTPKDMDALAKDAIAQQRRSGTNQQFASAVR